MKPLVWHGTAAYSSKASPDGPAPSAGRDESASSAGTAGDHTRIVLRPVASSAPLAFYAFGVGTVLYTASQLQWIPPTQDRTLALLLLTFPAPLQVIAGLIAFPARDTGMATAMVLFGAAWFAVGSATLAAPPGSRSQALGIFLFTIAAMVTALGAAAARVRPLLAGLAVLAVVRYTLTGVYQLSGSVSVEHASGWLGVPTALLSLYGGTAFLLEEAMRRPVLPVGRRHGASAAVEGDLDRQIEPLSQEAGVRHLM